MNASLLVSLIVPSLALQLRAAEAFLVEDGQPRAEIVISETPTRTQRLAAQELKDQVRKITGADLPIVTQPGGQTVRLYVGASPHLEKLGITDESLKAGAYRLVSGDNWMAFIGDDSDYVPREPWARHNGDIPRAQAEWEKIAGAPTGMPSAGMYKNRLKLPGTTGKPEGAATDPRETLELWAFDERGSFNAVCGFLRGLGARWFMPGEIGEVLPALKTIPLPRIDETVRPDFELRQFSIRFGTAGYDTAMWTMRLGTRNSERLQIAHGLTTMTSRDEIFAAHPEWFALYGGKRDYDPDSKKNQLCYSDEGLFQETVRWARSLIDTYQFETVSIMPPDGYTAICQCEKCQGKDSPDRDNRGYLSDYVWDFVNRVAREVGKTHPEARVLNCAYGTYTLPPEKIARLEPNVQVCIVGGRRPINKVGSKGEGESEPSRLRAGWAEKTAHPLLIFENYPLTARGWYLPCYDHLSLGSTVNATKGVTAGEDIWLSVAQDFATKAIGLNHFMVFFTASMYWGGPEADVEALFQEYCQLFYGPAAPEMEAFFRFGGTNWAEIEKSKEKADAALDLFAKAQAKADPASVHGQRMAFIDDFLKALRNKSAQLGQKRGLVPSVRLVGEASGIVIDGNLDDEYWQNCPVAATGRLRELQTGRQPVFGTSFKSGWQGGHLYFAIRCEEEPGTKPDDTATRDGDTALWYGDAVEILIETETHSYYQIAISPSGTVTDLDRAEGKRDPRWDSKAEVATRVHDDHWIIEVRIPVTQDENDPLHQVIGRKPILSLPWHINICRQRIREDGRELSALSPTGTEGFHEPMKFAHFYDGKSHQFEADPAVTDFVSGFRQATQGRKADAFLALAEWEKATDQQKSAALEQAALLDKANAATLIERIPVDAVRKTARMQSLLAQGQAPEVVARFATEDIDQWPFWKRGDGYFARGRAYAITGQGPEAEADLVRALKFTGDPRARDSVRLALGTNRERALQDETGALDAYRSLYEPLTTIGGSDALGAVQSAARILTRQGKYDEALATLERIDTEKIAGTWRHSTLIARAAALRAAGRRADALAAYHAVLADPNAEKRHRETAEAAIGELR